MRSAWLAAAVLLGSCATPDAWRPAELASVAALSFEPSTGNHPTEDLAMGIDGALVLPSPDGGKPIEVPHQRRSGAGLGARPAAPLERLLPASLAPGLGSLLWERELSSAPYHSGVQLYRTRQLKLLIGTRTLMDERYPDAVTTDPRHDPHDPDAAAVFGVRFGF